MLQKSGRTLLHSVRICSHALLSASSHATSNPLHTSLQPWAATKALSDSRRQPLSGWLSSLAVTGVAAGVIAANLEKVLLTDRMQLRINWLQPKTRDSGVMPVVNNLECCTNTAWSQDKQLCRQGLQLMLSVYAKAAWGTHCLAHEHPELQARLSTLPQTAKLQYHADQLEPTAGFSGGYESGKVWYDFWCRLKAKRHSM